MTTAKEAPPRAQPDAEHREPTRIRSLLHMICEGCLDDMLESLTRYRLGGRTIRELGTCLADIELLATTLNLALGDGPGGQALRCAGTALTAELLSAWPEPQGPGGAAAGAPRAAAGAGNGEVEPCSV